MSDNIACWALFRNRRTSQVPEDCIPVRHGSFLRHGNHRASFTAYFALMQFIDVLLDAHLRLLALDVAGRDLCVGVCYLVFVDTGSGFPEKLATGISGIRGLPVDPAVLGSNCKAFGIGGVVGSS